MRRTHFFSGLAGASLLSLLIVEKIKSESSKEFALGLLELAVMVLGAVVTVQVLLALRETRRNRTSTVSDHAASAEGGNLGKKVLRAIEERKLSPRPYAHFLARHLMIYAFASALLLLSAICLAVGVFALDDIITAGGRNFRYAALGDVFQTLPIIWLSTYMLFLASALVALFNTKLGYRYRSLGVSTAVIAASMVFGLLLHSLDAGLHTHNLLAMRFPPYERVTSVFYGGWQEPDQGYLGGEVLSVDAGRSLRLRDFDGQEWRVDISSAAIAVADPLVEEGDIAIHGQRKGALAFKASVINEFN